MTSRHCCFYKTSKQLVETSFDNIDERKVICQIKGDDTWIGTVSFSVFIKTFIQRFSTVSIYGNNHAHSVFIRRLREVAPLTDAWNHGFLDIMCTNKTHSDNFISYCPEKYIWKLHSTKFNFYAKILGNGEIRVHRGECRGAHGTLGREWRFAGVGNRQIHSELIEIYNIPRADVNTSMYQKLLNFMKDYHRKQRAAIIGPRR